MGDQENRRPRKELFDRIAPVYGMFFKVQQKNYAFVPELLYKNDIFPPMQILDVGCGTGALLSVLAGSGYRAYGIDRAEDMLKVARWKTRHQMITYFHLTDESGLPFPDNAFDVVMSSYVLHGMKKEERLALYREMKRVARRKVIIHDYNQNRSLPTTVIEYLEKGDYFQFIQVAEKEMQEVFGKVTVTHVGKRAAWYVMETEGPRIRAEA